MSLADAAALFQEFDPPLWIVTAGDGTRVGGLLASWVYPASIDPDHPLLIAALAAHHFTTPLVRGSGRFAAQLLRPDQVELAWQFGATSGHTVDKSPWLAAADEADALPTLAECHTRIECQVADEHQAGERVFFWGRARQAERFEQGAWLTVHAFFAALDDSRRTALALQLADDVRRTHPIRHAWFERNA